MKYRLKYKIPSKLEWQYEEINTTSPMMAKRVLLKEKGNAENIIRCKK